MVVLFYTAYDRLHHPAHRPRRGAHRPTITTARASSAGATSGLDARLVRRGRRWVALDKRATARDAARSAAALAMTAVLLVCALACASGPSFQGRGAASPDRAPRRLAEPARAPAAAGVRDREPRRGDDRRAHAVRRAVRGGAAPTLRPRSSPSTWSRSCCSCRSGSRSRAASARRGCGSRRWSLTAFSFGAMFFLQRGRLLCVLMTVLAVAAGTAAGAAR